MDVTINTSQPTQGTNSSNTSQTGVAAVQTEGQRADQGAERVVVANEKQNLENDLSNAEQKRFEAVKRAAANFIKGDNPFLSDVKFTIYNSSVPTASEIGSYEIRFTDLNSGKVDIKLDAELLGTASAGEIVSGNI